MKILLKTCNILFFLAKIRLFTKKERELTLIQQEYSQKSLVFLENVQKLSKNIEKIQEIKEIPGKSLVFLKKTEKYFSEEHFFNEIQAFTREITQILKENQAFFSFYLEKLENYKDITSNDRRVLSLKKENQALKQENEDLIKKNSILSAVFSFYYQKAVFYLKIR